MIHYAFTLFLILGCSSTKETLRYSKINTDIEKNFEKDDKSLEKFSVQEVIDPVFKKNEISGEPKKVKNSFNDLVKSKKNKEEVGQSRTSGKNIKRIEKKKSDLLLKVKSHVAEKLYEKKRKESPLPKDYPKKFLDYDKKAERVWNVFKPKVFLNEVHLFEVSYLGINAGTIRMETKQPVKIASEPAYHFKIFLKSADYYNYIYMLNDTLESFVRIRDFMPLKYKLVQRESGQEVDDLQVFDYDNQKTTFWYRKLKKGKEKKEKKEKYIPHFFQDSFSGLQFARGLPLKLGEKYEFPIVTRTKVWIMNLEIVDTFDKVSVAGEVFSAIKIKAETRFPGVLKKRGDIVFWFSNDDYRRLLKFEAKIKIGSVKGELVKYEKGKGLY